MKVYVEVADDNDTSVFRGFLFFPAAPVVGDSIYFNETAAVGKCERGTVVGRSMRASTEDGDSDFAIDVKIDY